MIHITINGTSHHFDSPLTLSQLLNQIGVDSEKVAVERNLEIVPRSEYRALSLTDGDLLEIVHFIGGGTGKKAPRDDYFEIAGQRFRSRLLIGTGKYADFEETRAAIEASGAEIVTVAVRRVNISDPGQPMLADYVDPGKYTYLPNTAGCFDASAAVRTLRLAREAGGWDLVKLEVLGDQETLYPNMPETIKAAQELIKDGFKVMVYCSDDPIQAKILEDMGCVAIMPLGSLIGSGLGILNPVNLRIIKENASVPVLVDAGVGTPSDATIAMEIGCDGVLLNTAIAAARNPVLMASAMKYAVQAGRLAYQAGPMPRKGTANASSPSSGLI